MRLWLKFSQADSLAFISHLDTHKAYYRMFRRADLPLAYSQGFNPHPVMSLAAPLPLGFASNADYLDLALAEDTPTEEITQRLLTVSGNESLTLQGLRVITTKVPALASLIAWGEYDINFRPGFNITEALQAFEAASEVPFVKETKRGTRDADAKTLVRSIVATEYGLRAILSLAEPVVFRPEELIKVLSKLSSSKNNAEIELVVRQELYVRGDGLDHPLQCGL
ncbi:MAG: TIGR03936 family radical SAM-associated protein [Bacillota bacterium]|nr:TIGR03936 family radical SAM-associated protein [Bacillota bacterium]